MQIRVMSRDMIEDFKSDEKHIVISISDPNSEKVKIKSEPLDIFSLQFHDVDKRLKKREDCKICKGIGHIEIFRNVNDGHCYSCTDKMDIKVFDEHYADEILEFVSTYALDIDLVVVHCEAGISRSAGVASALSLIYNGEDQYYFDNYLPNMLVYRKIINLAIKKDFFR
jgi:predicted protein tyrosine phosphatase